jgi:hypothetical protein
LATRCGFINLAPLSSAGHSAPRVLLYLATPLAGTAGAALTNCCEGLPCGALAVEAGGAATLDCPKTTVMSAG